MKYLKLVVTVLALSLSFAGLQGCTTAPQKETKEKVIIQVSDADPARWNLALNVAKNIQQEIGVDKVEIEIAVFGPGIGMLKLDSSVATRIEDAKKANVTVVACENTMKGQKLTAADMLPNTNYVKAGVVQVMKKQKEGYAYIRP